MAEFHEHPLHRMWKMYLHYPLYTSSTESYGSAAYHDVVQFSTVEDFWDCYASLPSPSVVFASEKRPRIKVGGRVLEGLGIFQDGVVPEWEKTPGGCHLEMSGITDLSFLDQLWEALCLAVVGESVCEDSPGIVGVRVVDKTKARKPLYRLEVWLSRQDDQLKDRVVQGLQSAFKTDGHLTDHLQQIWKKH